MARLCALIPVFNHAHPLNLVVGELDARALVTIIVDDGSNSDCAHTIDEVVAKAPERRHLLRLPHNQGKGAAVMAGLRHARQLGFSHVLQVDADGQHDLHATEKLLELLEQNNNALISGMPIFDASVPRTRYLARYLTHFWVWVNTLSFQLKDSMCGFRIYPLIHALAVMDRYPIGKRMEFDTEIMVRLYWYGVPVLFAPVGVRYPLNGISHFRLLRDNLRITGMHTRLFGHLLARLLTLRWRPDRLP